MLNYEDLAFIKVLLDEKSLVFFKLNMHLIKDALTRVLIWKSLYYMVKDGKLSSEEYVDIFLLCIPKEENDDIIAT